MAAETTHEGQDNRYFSTADNVLPQLKSRYASPKNEENEASTSNDQKPVRLEPIIAPSAGES